MEFVKDQESYISLQLSGGDTDKYPLSKIYDNTGTLVETLSLEHVTNGLYAYAYTPDTEGIYAVTYEVFSDSGHTSQDTYYDDIIGETLTVLAPNTGSATIIDLIADVRKYVSNSQYLDYENNILIIYDDDNVTPLVVYSLYDVEGNPAVTNVFRRTKV